MIPPMVDPFAAPYFSRALEAEAALLKAPVIGSVQAYDIVGHIDGPHTSVHIGRRDDALVVLKGYRPDTPPTAQWEAIRNNEALHMVRYGFGGVLPVNDVLSFAPGGPTTYLVLPYCQGGSLRTRLAAGGADVVVDIAELAFHLLAIACALRSLHGKGVIHGDLKPDNVLFAQGADKTFARKKNQWQVWLSDLETVARLGHATNWRLTPGYAAPEQIAGEPAAAPMDVWAWGQVGADTLACSAPVPAAWNWLVELIHRARSADPADRPGIDQIIDAYGQQVSFGDHKHAQIGRWDAELARYPIGTLPGPLPSWTANPDVSIFFVGISFGWAAWLEECWRLYDVHTVTALLRIEEMCRKVLGNPADPDSLWQTLRAGDGSVPLRVGPEAVIQFRINDDPSGPPIDIIRRDAAFSYVMLITTALVELVEMTGAPDDVERLREVTEAWEAIGASGSYQAIAILAQAWLTLDNVHEAMPYILQAHAADRRQQSVVAATRLLLVVIGRRDGAAKIAIEAAGEAGAAGDVGLCLRWFSQAAVDLLEAGEYDVLDRVLDKIEELAGAPVDLAKLLRLVLAGRRGPVHSDSTWRSLREHLRTIQSTTSIEKLRYIVEAAYQRGDLDYARPRAILARSRPAIRMPIHHEPRAAIEAVALGRDPSQRRLTARLNNRAELWSDDGEPDDPLVGLCLVAAERWVDGPGRSAVTEPARRLLARSLQQAGPTHAERLGRLAGCVVCDIGKRVADLSICGACHRLFCAGCIAHEQTHCACGGDLAHPHDACKEER